MNDLTQYRNPGALTEVDDIFRAYGEAAAGGPSLFSMILRRWRIVLLTFVVACAVGIPAIWLVVKPFYMATSAIQVSPVMASVLRGGGEGVPMYRSFMYTQAELIPSDKVLRQAAEDMATRGIALSGKRAASLQVADGNSMTSRTVANVLALRSALLSGDLKVVPADDSQLIKILTKSDDPEMAARISNALVRSYMMTLASDDSKGDEKRLDVLENERKRLEEEIKAHNNTIYQMSLEYGTDVLDGRQKMMLDRIAKLQDKLTEFEMERIGLEARMGSLKAGQATDGTPENEVKLRYEFTNSDPVVQALSERTAQLEQELVAARELMVPTNPKLIGKESLLEAVKKRLEARRDEIGKKFDTMLAESSKRGDVIRAEIAADKLQQISASSKQIREMLAKEDANTIALGRKQLAMQDAQNQAKLARDLYDTVQRRIKEVEIEGKGPARISVAYYATTIPFQDKRTKYSMAFSVFALMAGMGLALAKDKLDRSVHTPEDMARHIDVKILGTTVSRERMTRALWDSQVEHDYRAICANLDLLDEQGVPRSLVVTSPGPGEGKSTMAINLATNLARQGKKVLLIDGDLRKPDIARMMNLGNRGLGLQQFMAGAKFEDAVSATDIPGLMVLKADQTDASDIFHYVNRTRAARFIGKAREVFNHVIIDSPPVLVAVDALVWAKMVDGVIVTNLAGRTKTAELKEALTRLKGIKVKVLGAVLANVSSRSAYHPYGYGAYSEGHRSDTNGPSVSGETLPHITD
jgi:polysaccharide biosynthesis transport protein